SYNLMKDGVVGLVLLGVASFVYFRVIRNTRRLPYGWHAWIVLAWIAAMMLADSLYDSGEVARRALDLAHESGVTPEQAANTLALHNVEPVGWLGGRAFLAMGLTNASALEFLAMAGFWTHVTLVLAFLNYLPYGKHFHVITALPNVFF